MSGNPILDALGGVVGSAAGSATGASDVEKIVLALFQVALTPGGQAILDRVFVDHGMSIDSIAKSIAAQPRMGS